MRSRTAAEFRTGPFASGRICRSLTLLFAFALLAPAAGPAEPVPDAPVAGDAALATEITALLAAQADAWSRADLEGFCSLYAEDTLFLSPSGTTRGRAEILARYRSRYPDAAAMGRLALEVLEVRPGADLAGVAARWTLTYADRPAVSGSTLLVFRKTAAGWQIVQDASF